MASPSRLVRFFAALWRWLDASRRVALNLLFVFVLVAIGVAVVASGPPALKDRTALVLNLKGRLVEQRTGHWRDTLQQEAAGASTGDGAQLRDVLRAIELAASDARIERIVLALDEFDGSGLADLREVAAALQRFKAGGKQVIAWGSSYDQSQYYLAAQANEVWLDPMGMVYLKGLGGWRNYYRDALDRLGISANVMRVGSYKSFGEVYSANGPSKESIESEGLLYGALWSAYTQGVESARKLTPGSIQRGIDGLPQRFAEVGGDAAKLAVQMKLVDGLKSRPEMRQMMIERGVRDERNKSFRQIGYLDFLAHHKPKRTGDAVGVVIAEGDIVDGTAPAGKIGGISTADLIRKAREDDHVKAVVLRVNSPGGSAFASEQIRRELEATRAAGKPVVVSMGNVAASGGYWISMSADEVIAEPTTITGSIGVIAMMPTAEKAMDKLSLHTGGVTTAWLAGAYDPRRSLDPRFAQLVQGSIEHAYAEFTGRAAKARHTTPDKIDAVGQGRVWTGAQAKERNLIDTLGSFGDALRSAARRAKLGDGFRVEYVELEPGRLERLMSLAGVELARIIGAPLQREAALATGLLPATTRETLQDLHWLGALTEGRKPFEVVTHCLCEVTP
ncbi:MAG TPA: signal peptide peptidase SppA [Burkholderiaceae bacterium]|nr:signal peptide peptidase SppA [Burkholderiaceae bacterium]